MEMEVQAIAKKIGSSGYKDTPLAGLDRQHLPYRGARAEISEGDGFLALNDLNL